MADEISQSMIDRIEHLERANRTMKFIAIGAVLACIALNAIPASSAFPHGPKRVDAEMFNLVSPKGVLIATLASGVNGGFLAFYDATGKPEMSVGVGASDPSSPTSKSMGVAIFDGNTILPRTDGKPGVARMVWAADSIGGVATAFGESIFDANSMARLSNATVGDGSDAGSFYYDSSETLRAGIGLGGNGPGVFFNDSAGIARILEGVTADDSAAAFSMLGASANTLANLSAVGDGSATTLQISDHNGTTRALEGFSTVSGEIIQLKNVGDTQTFLAPCTGAACP
jgi:hypothetical protein